MESLHNVYISDRKRQILGLLVTGCSNKRIAQMLGISPNTVRNHLHELSEATGINNRTALALAAVNNGWVDKERVEVVETSLSGWEPGVLPLDDTRKV